MPPRFSAFLFVLAFTTALRAQTPVAPDFRADSLGFDAASGEAVGRGHAQLTYDGALLTADTISYNAQTQTATARGNVKLTRGPLRLLASEVQYRLTDKHLEVKDLRMGDHPLYLTASSVSGNEASFVATEAEVSYYEPTPFSPRLKAGTLTYTPQKSVEARHARVGLGPLRPFPVAHFKQDIKAPFLSYVEGSIGYRSRLGAYADLGLHAPVWPGWAVGADVGLFSKRGALVGPSGSYKLTTETGTAVGRLRSGYIYDFGDRFTDALGRPIDRDRGLVSWQHLQTVGDQLTLRANFNYWSDSEMTRDFRPRDFYSVQQPDSYVEADYTTPNAVWSLFARPQPNNFFQAQERLPELRVDGLPYALPLGIYQRYEASVAVLQQRAVLTEPKLRSQRFDAYYGLQRPFAYRDIATFSPVAGARVTHYADALNGKSTYTRTLGEVGFDAQLHFNGRYDYRNEAWKIDGIRHLLTPKVSYRYIPEAEKGTAYIPPIDDEVYITYLEPLGLGEGRRVDRIHRTNTIRLGLDNTWQTRDRQYGSRDLLRANFAFDIDADARATEESHSDLHTEVALTPAPWLAFHAYQRIDTDTGVVREMNTGVSVVDGEYWRVTLATHFLQNQIEGYIAETSYRANEVYRLSARLHWDARRSRFVEQNYGVVHNLDNLWRLRYGVSVYNGSARESNLGFTISAELKGF